MNFRGRNVSEKELSRLVIFGIGALLIIFFIFSLLKTAIGIYEVRRNISDCREAIAQKNSELNRLEQKKAYYESDEFLEDAVRNGGYVGDDETVFVITN